MSITDPAGTVIVFSTHVMISLQSSSFSPFLFLWSQFSWWGFYCLSGCINGNVRLEWVHTNCIWSGRALKHKQTNWLREVSLVKSEALLIPTLQEPQRQQTLCLATLANGNPRGCRVMCEHTVTSVFIRFSLTQPLPLFFAMSSFFFLFFSFTACSWLRLVFRWSINRRFHLGLH